MNIIKPFKPLSTNVYVKRTQLKENIETLRDILQNQKFTNHIVYDFRLLIDSINFYKKELAKTEKDISDMEQLNFAFGGPLNT